MSQNVKQRTQCFLLKHGVTNGWGFPLVNPVLLLRLLNRCYKLALHVEKSGSNALIWNVSSHLTIRYDLSDHDTIILQLEFRQIITTLRRRLLNYAERSLTQTCPDRLFTPGINTETVKHNIQAWQQFRHRVVQRLSDSDLMRKVSLHNVEV